MPPFDWPKTLAAEADGAGFLADLWLKWPMRADATVPRCSSDRGKQTTASIPAKVLPELGKIDAQGNAAPASLRYILEAERGLESPAFVEHVRRVRQDLKLDDVLALIGEFRSELHDIDRGGGSLLAALYRGILKADGVGLIFDCGHPQVSGDPAAFERWARIIDFFDPDNFVALTIAGLTRNALDGCELQHMLDAWPLVVSSADTDLHRLFVTGLSDLHLHFKSLWPASLSWQRVLRHGAILADGRRLNDGYAASKLPAYALHRFRASEVVDIEMRLIDEARQAVFSRELLGCCRPADIPFLDRLERLPSRPRDVLRAERVMLLRGWRHILCRTPGFERLEVALDRYLLAKNLFRARHMQSFENTNPGLTAFDVTRRHNSHLGRFTREETSGNGFSEARFRMNNGALLGALLECGSLRRAELRIAPPSTSPARMAAAYGRMMLASHRLLTRNSARAEGKLSAPVDIKFAIHFKRSPGTTVKTGDHRTPPTAPTLRKLMEFDLETATLHDFRYRASTSRWRQESDLYASCALIGRVDLAGPERGAGPWLAAPYIRLLRGDPDAIAGLETAGGNPYLARWFTLHRQGHTNPAHDIPALALTCHAGEDFYTLIDGLWHIDSVIEAWNLAPGDGIGHGLALGVDVHAFCAHRLQGVRLPFGLELDSLIWLHAFLARNWLGQGRRWHDLQSHIIDRALDCYGHKLAAGGIHTLTERILHEKIDRLHHAIPACPELALGRLPTPLPANFVRSLKGGDFLRVLDMFDSDIGRHRARLVAPAPIHSDLFDELAHVQQRILWKIQSRGLIIETNPSSNLRMERAPTIASLPVMKLLKRGIRPRVTVCTDNPGIYDTNVESEYALLFSGLMSALDGDRDAALRILRDLRDTGMCHVKWRTKRGTES